VLQSDVFPDQSTCNCLACDASYCTVQRRLSTDCPPVRQQDEAGEGTGWLQAQPLPRPDGHIRAHVRSQQNYLRHPLPVRYTLGLYVQATRDYFPRSTPADMTTSSFTSCRTLACLRPHGATHAGHPGGAGKDADHCGPRLPDHPDLRMPGRKRRTTSLHRPRPLTLPSTTAVTPHRSPARTPDGASLCWRYRPRGWGTAELLAQGVENLPHFLLPIAAPQKQLLRTQ
jgi:hypothetical protein